MRGERTAPPSWELEHGSVQRVSTPERRAILDSLDSNSRGGLDASVRFAGRDMNSKPSNPCVICSLPGAEPICSKCDTHAHTACVVALARCPKCGNFLALSHQRRKLRYFFDLLFDYHLDWIHLSVAIIVAALLCLNTASEWTSSSFHNLLAVADVIAILQLLVGHRMTVLPDRSR